MVDDYQSPPAVVVLNFIPVYNTVCRQLLWYWASWHPAS